MGNWMRNKEAVVIGGSAGSIQALNQVIPLLPGNFGMPLIVCLHRMKSVPGGMMDVFSRVSRMPVREPDDKEPVRSGCLYVAPANYHLLISCDRTFSLSTEEDVNFSRPCIDLTLRSAARAYGSALLGILLTGANSDGASGMKSISAGGGTTIVQDPCECAASMMPRSAIELSKPDYIMDLKGITATLLELNRYSAGFKSGGG